MQTPLPHPIWVHAVAAAAAAAVLLPSLVGAGPHKVLDLRTQTSASGAHEIGLCGRPTPDSTKNLPAHAFVSFSHQEPSGDRAFVAVGHTTAAPQEIALLTYSKVLPPVPGLLSEERYSAIREQCLILKVNDQIYGFALRLTKNHLAGSGSEMDAVRAAYTLTSEECLTFVLQVVSVVNNGEMALPPRRGNEVPLQYIRRVIEAN